MISISKEFKVSPYILDKTTQSLSSLPYNYENCKIKSNQYITSDVINLSIERLYSNYMYLYRGCSVGNFNLFYSYLYSVSSTNTTPFYKSINNGFSEFIDNRSSQLSGSHKAVFLPYNTKNQNNVLFYVNDKTINCLNVERENLQFIFSTNFIDPLSGDIQFLKITDIKYDKRDSIFIVDGIYNNIYKYNITNFLQGENIYKNKLFVSNYIGGVGDVSEKNKFNGILNVAIDGEILIAQDVNNKCFKLYDYNLNWLGTSIFIRIFDKVKKFDAIYLYNNILYCGVNEEIYKFQLKDKTLVFDKIYNLKNYFSESEKITGIEKIDSNNDIVYIITQFSVKKVWLSSLEYVVGEVKVRNVPISKRRAVWIASGKYSEDLDIVALYGFNYDTRRENFSIFFDNVFYETILNENDFEIYPLKDCKFDQNEYVQSSTILSKFKKIYYNTFLLLQNIKYKFLEDSTEPYPIIQKKLYSQNFLGFTEDLKFDDNFDIGYNEILQAEVINRCISQILDIQLIAMLFFVNNQNDKTYLSPDPFINISNIKNYVYFSDESIILTPNPSKINIFEELSPGGGILTSLGGAPYTGLNGITIEQGVNT